MRILTLGGHDFTRRGADRAIRDYMLGLLGQRHPRICLLATASGDPADQISRFHDSFGAADCGVSDLSLFRLPRRPVALRDHLLSQDLIYVGGGSMVNLLAVWEAHDLAAILRLAWKGGTLLAGQSAGAMCWFEAGVTKSSGRPSTAAGLGLISGSLCVHYHDEPERRLAYLSAIELGLPGGFGLDDYTGLLFSGGRLSGAICARPGAGAFRVTASPGAEGPEGGGGVIETRLEALAIKARQTGEGFDDIDELRRVRRLRPGPAGLEARRRR
jgi:dipeptidase E